MQNAFFVNKWKKNQKRRDTSINYRFVPFLVPYAHVFKHTKEGSVLLFYLVLFGLNTKYVYREFRTFFPSSSSSFALRWLYFLWERRASAPLRNLTSKMRCHQCHLPVQVNSDYFAVAIFLSVFCKITSLHQIHFDVEVVVTVVVGIALVPFSRKEGKKWEEFVISLMYWNTFMLWLAHSWFIIFCNFSLLLSLSFQQLQQQCVSHTISIVLGWKLIM